jgi:hypothetical protein
MPNLISQGSGDWIAWFGVVNGLLTLQSHGGAAWQYHLPKDAQGKSLAVTIYGMMKGPAPALSGATSRRHNLKTKKTRHAGPEFWIDQLLGNLPYQKIAPPNWVVLAAGGPSIAGMTPLSGPAAGGTAVIITGSGFNSVPTLVELQRVTLDNMVIVSDTEIDAVTHGGTPGSAQLYVSNAYGSTTWDGFSYIP